MTDRLIRRPRSLGEVLFGLLLVLAGGAAMATVFAANVGRSQATEVLAFDLGLAFAPALAAVGLCLALIGWFVFLRGEPSFPAAGGRGGPSADPGLEPGVERKVERESSIRRG